MPTHSGRIAPCATVPGAAVDGAGNSDAGTHHGAALHAAVREQPVQQPDGGLDAFLGVVAQGQQDGFLGDHVVAQRGQHHAQVPPAEVDSDGHCAVAVEPDVQGPPPELVIGSVEARPASCMILTMLETVAVDRPVWRASSAWVEGPARRHSMIRCWFRCRRADCDPGFLVRLLVERVGEGMLRSVTHRGL